MFYKLKKEVKRLVKEGREMVFKEFPHIYHQKIAEWHWTNQTVEYIRNNGDEILIYILTIYTF